MDDTTTDLDQTENATPTSEVSNEAVEAVANTHTSSGSASKRPSTFARNIPD
jgi:hypothetical protein